MKLHPLESAREKIHRANENILHLNADIARFLTDTEPTVKLRDDEQLGQKLVGVEGRIIPPLRYAVVAGEIVHHLRSALDHVAFQLVVSNKGTPSTKTEFPVFVDSDEYVSKHAAKVQGMSDRAKALIESLQPFKQGHTAALDHPLWIVHQLDVADKHRLLVVIARRTTLQHVISSGPWPAPSTYTSGVTIDSVSPDSSTQANAVVARLTVAPNVKVNPSVACELVFDRIGRSQFEPVIPTLQNLSDTVRSTAELFAPFFP